MWGCVVSLNSQSGVQTWRGVSRDLMGIHVVHCIEIVDADILHDDPHIHMIYIRPQWHGARITRINRHATVLLRPKMKRQLRRFCVQRLLSCAGPKY